MLITVKRPPITTNTAVISPFLINNVHFSDVLEDQDRGLFKENSLDFIKDIKIKHETAIPYGTYQVIMSYSNKFEKYLPELLDVPGFAGIRIHSGNTKNDSSGCLLLGTKQGDKVVNSRVAVTSFIKTIESVLKKEKIFIEIVPTPYPEQSLSQEL